MCGTRDMFFELFRFEIGHGLRRNWIWILEGVTVPIYSSLEQSMINSVIASLSCGSPFAFQLSNLFNSRKKIIISDYRELRKIWIKLQI